MIINDPEIRNENFNHLRSQLIAKKKFKLTLKQFAYFFHLFFNVKSIFYHLSRLSMIATAIKMKPNIFRNN